MHTVETDQSGWIPRLVSGFAGCRCHVTLDEETLSKHHVINARHYDLLEYCDSPKVQRLFNILINSSMKVESIKECSKGNILQDLHKAIIGLENQFVVFLRVTFLDRYM